MSRRVLGIDVASASWRANGSAVIEYDDATSTFLHVVPGAIDWPSVPLTIQALADEIDHFARRDGVAAVALDGPQGWRDPATDRGTPGVGRRCEYECHAQAKTGAYPLTCPRNQRPWIEFCIELFAALLARPGVVLANRGSTSAGKDGYVLLECFPTSTWRTSRLKPLPGKGKGSLASYLSSLTTAYGLPPFTTSSHDDLQAVVAALTAVGFLGGPATVVSRGIPATILVDSSGVARRVEGFIWDAQPVTIPGTHVPAPPKEVSPVAGLNAPESGAAVYVTRQVLEQVNRSSDPKQAQIAFGGIDGATKATQRRVTFKVEDEEYTLVIGDSHAIWPTHQEGETAEAFERLFALLADRPDERIPASVMFPSS